MAINKYYIQIELKKETDLIRSPGGIFRLLWYLIPSSMSKYEKANITIKYLLSGIKKNIYII